MIYVLIWIAIWIRFIEVKNTIAIILLFLTKIVCELLLGVLSIGALKLLILIKLAEYIIGLVTILAHVCKSIIALRVVILLEISKDITRLLLVVFVAECGKLWVVGTKHVVIIIVICPKLIKRWTARLLLLKIENVVILIIIIIICEIELHAAFILVIILKSVLLIVTELAWALIILLVEEIHNACLLGIAILVLLELILSWASIAKTTKYVAAIAVFLHIALLILTKHLI